MIDKAQANANFQAADQAWNAQLIYVFGKKSAPYMRYNTAGRGMPHSNLRKAYDVREAARKTWADACGLSA
ncbi:hypothetical protein [Rhizobium laguerreae]|uniref:hypothetical protein n=1 Tax=Rhizobium laguerreae TaxID=1076926 RepID=UPI001C924C79|nr:hypothetical protein [Rhizobium laguerreae]MBY3038918.1 hypothetical protein [Rhizobium laguerreae]